MPGAALDRWWDDASRAGTVLSGVKVVPHPVQGVGTALLGYHAIAKAALAPLASGTLEDRQSVSEALSEVDLGPVVDAVRSSVGDDLGEASDRYAQMMVRDVHVRAVRGADRIIAVLVNKGVPWPAAIDRAASIVGVPAEQAGRYVTGMTAAAVPRSAQDDAADRTLMQWAAKVASASAGASGRSQRQVSKRERERSREATNPGRKVWDESKVKRDEDGQFASRGSSRSKQEDTERAARAARRKRRMKRAARSAREAAAAREAKQLAQRRAEERSRTAAGRGREAVPRERAGASRERGRGGAARERGGRVLDRKRGLLRSLRAERAFHAPARSLRSLFVSRAAEGPDLPVVSRKEKNLPPLFKLDEPLYSFMEINPDRPVELLTEEAMMARLRRDVIPRVETLEVVDSKGMGRGRLFENAIMDPSPVIFRYEAGTVPLKGRRAPSTGHVRGEGWGGVFYSATQEELGQPYKQTVDRNPSNTFDVAAQAPGMIYEDASEGGVPTNTRALKTARIPVFPVGMFFGVTKADEVFGVTKRERSRQAAAPGRKVWDESSVERDAEGRFASQGGGGESPEARKARIARRERRRKRLRRQAAQQAQLQQAKQQAKQQGQQQGDQRHRKVRADRPAMPRIRPATIRDLPSRHRERAAVVRERSAKLRERVSQLRGRAQAFMEMEEREPTESIDWAEIEMDPNRTLLHEDAIFVGRDPVLVGMSMNGDEALWVDMRSHGLTLAGALNGDMPDFDFLFSDAYDEEEHITHSPVGRKFLGSIVSSAPEVDPARLGTMEDVTGRMSITSNVPDGDMMIGRLDPAGRLRLYVTEDVEGGLEASSTPSGRARQLTTVALVSRKARDVIVAQKGLNAARADAYARRLGVGTPHNWERLPMADRNITEEVLKKYGVAVDIPRAINERRASHIELAISELHALTSPDAWMPGEDTLWQLAESLAHTTDTGAVRLDTLAPVIMTLAEEGGR